MAELAPRLEGRALEGLLHLPPRDLVLCFERAALETRGEPPPRLRLSADPEAPRLHLESARVAPHEGPPGPFYLRLREELAGARLARLTQVRGDRLALLEFRETPAGAARALAVELIGRASNLILLDQAGCVLARLVEPTGSGAARSLPGRTWSPPAARAAAEAGPGIEQCFAGDAGAARSPTPLSERVERAFAAFLGGRDREGARADLLGRLARRIAKTRGHLAGLEKRREAAGGAERLTQDGELLKAHQAELARGLESVELEDWYAPGSPPRRIELDPRLSGRENAERLFARAKKLTRSMAQLGQDQELARERLSALEEFEGRAREAADPAALLALAEERGLVERPQLAPERRKPAPRLPYRAFRGSKGTEIRVGRSASDNDDLTLHHSNGNDLWLHTADAPGSHVVLRLERGAEPDPEEQLDAAHLAVHFSPLRGARKADVHVARRKEVHKPRGAKAGLVTLSGGKVLQLRLEPERLKRLLRGGEAPAGEAGA